MNEAIELGNKLGATWMRLYKRIIQAESDGYRLDESFENVLNRVNGEFKALQLSMHPKRSTQKEMARFFLDHWDSELKILDKNFPRIGGAR
jgi:hypothetical protein